MKVECISEYISDSDIGFDFNHSVFEAVNQINQSISEAHKETLRGDVEEKRIAPIQYIEEKTYQDGDLRFNPLEEITADYESEIEEEVCQMESAKTVGSVKKGYGAMQVKEAKITPNAGKRHIGKDTVHHEEHAHVSQDKEQARRQYMMRQMNGRDY
ncbi:hypothetical protein HMPREF1014_05523 [Bacillus sp. 7_6_55CFAA_CT2]|nr:hypothetical protein HMPREF1014_05523 [Bacillus sp. 7_6_55CFAA_CT2]